MEWVKLFFKRLRCSHDWTTVYEEEEGDYSTWETWLEVGEECSKCDKFRQYRVSLV